MQVGEAGAQAPEGNVPTFRADAEREFASGKVIVKFEEDATRAEKADARGDEGLQKREDLGLIGAEVDTVKGQSVEQAVRDLEKRPDVEYAEPDYVVEASATPPNDTYFPRLYGLENTGQVFRDSSGVSHVGSPDADIDAPEAWETTAGGPETVVAVIDTGVDTNHPDLKNSIWTNPDEVAGNGLDDDRNGYVDDVHGYDFVNNDASVYDPDLITGEGDEHGTHVAGTIAAEGNNSLGVVGVAYNAKIMSLKFLGPNGEGSTSGAVRAIDYAIKEGVKISNNSWGGTGYSQSLRDAIARADAAGHLVVAAAGNGGADGVGDDNDAAPHYPANYDLPNVVSVAATDNKDALASFSNYGARSVDVAAPGVFIGSTLPGNSYGLYSGTSMATPHVAGIAALLKSKTPTLDDVGIKDLILRHADQKSGLEGKTATGARVNAHRSVTSEPAPAPAPAPAPVPAPAPAAAPAPPQNYAAPEISGLRPANGASTRDRTPTIGAVVRDSQTELAKGNVALYVDGRRVTNFAYNAGTDRLTYTTRTLGYGRHTVKVVANDGQLSSSRTWRFTVAR